MPRTKRSLEDAFELTPEVLSFVNNEKVEKPKQPPKQEKQSVKNEGSNSSKRNAPKPNVNKAPSPVQLVPFSTRLPKELVNRLTLCGTKRKLEGKLYWKHQDIAEQAISDWLKKHEREQS